jgi:hypothetical protein
MSEALAPTQSRCNIYFLLFLSPTDHGVLSGPLCDFDHWLWSVLSRLDPVASGLCYSMEVSTIQPGMYTLKTMLTW